MENNNSNKGWALGFGLLAGIAVGYYLNSNEGRAIQRKARARFDEYGNQINEYGQVISTRASEYATDARTKVNELSGTAKTRASELTETAKQTLTEGKTWANDQINTLKSTVTDTADSVRQGASDLASNTESSFQRGVNKAKRKVDENRVKVEQVKKS